MKRKAAAKAYRDLSLLFARRAERNCADVSNSTAPDDTVVDTVAAELISGE